MHRRFGGAGVKLNMFTVGNGCDRLLATRRYRREVCGSAFLMKKMQRKCLFYIKCSGKNYRKSVKIFAKWLLFFLN